MNDTEILGTWERRTNRSHTKIQYELALYLSACRSGGVYGDKFARRYHLSTKTIIRYAEDLKYVDPYLFWKSKKKRLDIFIGYEKEVQEFPSIPTENGRRHIERLKRMVQIVSDAIDQKHYGCYSIYELEGCLEEDPALLSYGELMQAAKEAYPETVSVRTLQRDSKDILAAIAMIME